MKKLAIIGIISLVSLSVAGSAFAQAGPTQGLPTGGPTTVAGIVTIVTNVMNWVFVLFVIIAIIFIILAAFQFLTASGEPAALAQARTRLIWAAVAIGVAIIAQFFDDVIANLLGVSAPGGF